MTRPESFILNSDYASISNDGTGTLSVTFPGSVVIPGSGSREFTSSIDIGVRGAVELSQISSSRMGKRYVGSVISVNRGSVDPYSIAVYLGRSSATTLTLVAIVVNPYNTSITTEGTAELFTAYVKTFIPPFA